MSCCLPEGERLHHQRFEWARSGVGLGCVKSGSPSDIQVKVSRRWLDTRVWNSGRGLGWRCINVGGLSLGEITKDVNACGKLRGLRTVPRAIHPEGQGNEEGSILAIGERADGVGGKPRAWGKAHWQVLQGGRSNQRPVKACRFDPTESSDESLTNGRRQLGFLTGVWIVKHGDDEDKDTNYCHLKNSEGTVSS